MRLALLVLGLAACTIPKQPTVHYAPLEKFEPVRRAGVHVSGARVASLMAIAGLDVVEVTAGVYVSGWASAARPAATQTRWVVSIVDDLLIITRNCRTESVYRSERTETSDANGAPAGQVTDVYAAVGWMHCNLQPEGASASADAADLADAIDAVDEGMTVE